MGFADRVSSSPVNLSRHSAQSRQRPARAFPVAFGQPGHGRVGAEEMSRPRLRIARRLRRVARVETEGGAEEVRAAWTDRLMMYRPWAVAPACSQKKWPHQDVAW